MGDGSGDQGSSDDSAVRCSYFLPSLGTLPGDQKLTNSNANIIVNGPWRVEPEQGHFGILSQHVHVHFCIAAGRSRLGSDW